MTERTQSFRFYFLIYFLSGFTLNGFSQDYFISNSYQVENGVASNHIYEMCEDKKGFLWIATDNGVSRFDGKTFYNYTIKNGLPSNDVLQVAMGSDGTIWANCYRETPSYFDEKRNIFVSFEGNEKIEQLSNTLLEHVNLPTGEIRFYGVFGSVDFKGTEISNVRKNHSFGYIKTHDSQVEIEAFGKKNDLGLNMEIVQLYHENKVLRHLDTLISNQIFKRVVRNNHYFVFEKSGQINVYGDINMDSKKHTKKVIQVGETIKWCSFSANYLAAIANSGSVYLYDLSSYQMIQKIAIDVPLNSVYLDRHKNVWVGTIDNGLHVYKKSNIRIVQWSPEETNNNMLSIAATQEGQIVAGNNRSQIFNYSPQQKRNEVVISTLPDLRLREIIPVQEDIYIFTDNGFSVNGQPVIPVYYENSSISTSIKSAILLNKQQIIIGTINGLYTLSLPNNQVDKLKSPFTRYLNLARKDENSFYAIHPGGLMHYNTKNQSFYSIPVSTQGMKNKPAILSLAPNKGMWIATVKGDLIYLQNEKVLDFIPNEAGLPENITCLLRIGNKLWIGSKSGIFILSYSIKNGKIRYSLNNLSTSKGLGSNVINQLITHEGKVYAATDKGISIIENPINFPKYEIVPRFISMRINNIKVPFSPFYELDKNEKNIRLQLAGPQLSGHFKNFEYLINSTGKWAELEENILNITLKGGRNIILVRAVDDNNNISSARLKIEFEVAIPFYNKIWFWGLVVFALTGIVFWFYNNRKFNRQQELFQQKLELERQRNKITADLHDDIGATLSSLQINSMVASKLIDQNPTEVKSVLHKIEHQAENLAEKIGDIIWSMKPGKDEFISLSMRVKNFANDILGSTNIQYKIKANSLLDSEIQDITMRKNIVLFFKEAINNAAKYSTAKMVNISMEYQNERIHLEVQDDGKGFQIDQKTGNGISNMRHRIEELNGKFEVISEINVGTTVKASIPFLISNK